jgi:nicotinic acid mononucleotide adenylyltransferase
MPAPRDASDDVRREAYRRLVAGLSPAGEPRVVWADRRPAGAPRLLGVLAASFNPPTRAHVAMAERARKAHCLDAVILELATANVDKEVSGAPLHERLMMLWRLARTRTWLRVAVTTHGRFLDKAVAFGAVFPSAELVFLVGYDTLVRVFDAKYYTDREAELDALFRQVRFVCAGRGDVGAEGIRRFMEVPENRAYAGRVAALELAAEEASVSSTRVRQALADGAWSEDVPPAVMAYIAARGLYRRVADE